ncbi:Uncharacterized protein PHSC3_000590 [Chlamydiales bacterium STE3]|nr:Uncharacterized protein PHSC3_000590 [Chlamydiales bacterium STE3]
MPNKHYKFFLNIFLLLNCSMLMAERPLAVYLTWQHSPHDTMTVHWVTPLDEKQDFLSFRKADASIWQKEESKFTPLPNRVEYGIHRIELTHLESNSEYIFRLGEDPKEYKFLTMPSQLTEPLSFVIGGDIYHNDLASVIAMNLRAVATSPRFVIWGGDLAYSANRFFVSFERWSRWLDLMAIWSSTMITKEGHLIPLLTVIGNHEVVGRYDQTPAQASFYYTFFPTPGYQVLDFGNYMSLFLLDSGHTHPIEGEQSAWLKEVLAKRQNIPFKFACYHVPAFPSIRDYRNKRCAKVRENWVPIFEQSNLLAAFENHDHAYKRTHPILNGKPAENGVLFLGDGSWGVNPARKPRAASKSWYLAKTEGQRHFIKVTLDPSKKVLYQAVNDEGVIFDEYVQTPR